MAGLDWLDSVEVTAPDKPARKGGGGVKKERNPTDADIRIFKNGSIYPSQELVDRFDLEYHAKDDDAQGFGFDIIDSATVPQYFPDLKGDRRVILISGVDRNNKDGRISIFGSVGYHDEKSVAKVGGAAVGDPISDVLNQGAGTFGKDDLLPMIKEVYGIELSDDVPYVDLEFVGKSDGSPLRLPLADKVNIAYLPKKASRGEKAKQGITNTVKRERPEFWVLYPVAKLEPQEATVATESAVPQEAVTA